MTMICAHCQHVTASGRFCQDCGKPLSSPAGGITGDISAVRSTVIAGSTVIGADALAALSPLVECPICWRKNTQIGTFRCRNCGREHLCISHQDPRTYWCSECVQRKQEQVAAEAELKRKTDELIRRLALHHLRLLDQDRIALDHAPTQLSMEFVRIPAGDFLMGSDKAIDSPALEKEMPQHSLRLPEYWIARTPVTVTQFAAFVKAAGHKTMAETLGYSWCWTGKWEKIEKADWAHPGGPATDVAQKQDHPVTHVSWGDSMAYSGWVSGLCGREVVLPSEAEWEKAARGSDGRVFPWGIEAPDDTRLNYNLNVKDTTPVGRYGAKGQSPNACDDMAGNVWEWTRSLWGNDPSTPEFGYPYAARQLEREDAQAGGDVLRVLRGGSFLSSAQGVRCAFRDGFSLGNRSGDRGFRVILRPQSLD
jgi:formylglycine-generating enzyme required for sulfatase activity